MNILIVYATYSGGTQVAAELMRNILTEKNHQVTLKRVDSVEAGELKNHDLVVMGSPSWLQDKQDGQPHKFYFDFFTRLQADRLDGVKIALYGLGDRDFARFTHAVDIIGQELTQKGAIILPDPLRIDSFHFKQDESQALITSWVTNLLAGINS